MVIRKEDEGQRSQWGGMAGVGMLTLLCCFAQVSRTVRKHLWATRAAQSVKRPTLDFDSGHDLMVRGFEPHVGLCTDGVEPAWDSLPLSVSVCLCPLHTLSK